MDEVPPGARHDRPGHRPRAVPQRAPEERDGRGPRRSARALGRRRAADPAFGPRGDLHLAGEVGPGIPHGPAVGVGRRAPARDPRLRVRRQPQRDRRRPLDRQRRAPGRRRHCPDGRGLRGPRGGAPDVLRDRARHRHLPLHDSLRRGPLHARQEGRPRHGRAHPVEVPQGFDRRPALRRRRTAGTDLRDLQDTGRPVPHQHQGRPGPRPKAPRPPQEPQQAGLPHHRRQALGDLGARAALQESLRPGPEDRQPHARGGRRLPPRRDHDHDLHDRHGHVPRRIRGQADEDQPGRAYYASPYNLAEFLFTDYIRNRKKFLH